MYRSMPLPGPDCSMTVLYLEMDAPYQKCGGAARVQPVEDLSLVSLWLEDPNHRMSHLRAIPTHLLGKAPHLSTRLIDLQIFGVNISLSVTPTGL